jgi:hypothetical protein
MLIKYLKNLFNKTIQPKPTPEKNQIWTFPFDIADKYCTPVVFTVVDVKEDEVFFFTNFSKEIKHKNVQYFRENLELQNFSC